MNSCFFTGHRNVKPDKALISKTTDVMTRLITQENITDFYAGGALGWDTICAGLVLDLKEKYPQIKLHLVLPCAPEFQTAKWDHRQKEEYYRILRYADDVEFVSKNYSSDCMKKRNARLAESGEICVCYFNEQNTRSGTSQTVRMAQRFGKRIYNLANMA